MVATAEKCTTLRVKGLDGCVLCWRLRTEKRFPVQNFLVIFFWVGVEELEYGGDAKDTLV